MKTIIFNIEIDLSESAEISSEGLTPDQLVEIGSEIDTAIRRHNMEFSILPKELQYSDVDVKLIRVKPIITITTNY